MGVERLDPQQEQILREFPAANPRNVAVKSGHACGKTFLAAVIALWFWYTRFPAIVLTTAPTFRQVRHVLWKEIRERFLVAKSRWPTSAEIMEQQIKHQDPKAQFMGFTSKDEADRFQGFHGGRVLVIVEEASGIGGEIETAIKGVTTGELDRQLKIGNPPFDPAAEFYQAFTLKADLWTRYTLDSEQSSHCSAEWIQDRARDWGRESALFQARVKGQLPRVDVEALVAPEWIEAANERWTADADKQIKGAVTLGVDVARFGKSSTVFAYVCGRRVLLFEVFQGRDTMQTAGAIASAVRDGKVPAGHVIIDDTGVGGGVTDRLHELSLNVLPFNFGAAALDPERYANARTEIFWKLREALREGKIDLPPDGELIRELCAPRFGHTSSGALKLEPKEDTIKRLGYSPDRADATALAWSGQAYATASLTVAGPAPLTWAGQVRPPPRYGRVSSKDFGRSLRVGRPSR